jgi:hypothetical protein
MDGEIEVKPYQNAGDGVVVERWIEKGMGTV